ncbi:MAG TPA: XRE family transcriptional regulator [Devosia sp.]|nr:XRE family transcriptional regulator [Devosia sp.]
MLKDVLFRIEERLVAVGLSAAAASTKAGLSIDAIRNIRRKVEAGQEAGVSSKTLAALAPVLGTTVAYLVDGAEGGADQDAVRPASEQMIPATVAGRVAAGMFFEVDEFDQSERERVWVPADPRYPNARIVLFDVDGTSMNDLRPRPILDGDRLVTLSFEDLNIPIRDGMVVVVERTRDGGHTREWSVKQVEFYQDRIEFHPRSTDPKWKPIVVKHEDDQDNGVQVTILALVTQILNTLPTF